MSKLQNLPLYKQAVRVYLLSLFFSALFSPIFNKLYEWIFKPKMFQEGLLMPFPQWFSIMLIGSFLGIFFFLPLFVFWIIEKKKWKVIGVGIVIPFFIISIIDKYHFLLTLILFFAGWLLAWIFLLFRRTAK